MEEQRSEVSILALSSAVSSLHRGGRFHDSKGLSALLAVLQSRGRAGGKLAGQLEVLPSLFPALRGCSCRF